MTRDSPRGLHAGTAGQLLAGCVLAGLALWLLWLQPRPWFAPVAQAARWSWAAFALVAYAAFTGAILWRARPRVRAGTGADGADAFLVVHASQTGFAAALAERTAGSLRDAGCEARVVDLARLQPSDMPRARACLFVVATTGEGDPPDHVAGFVRDVMSAPARAGTRYGVLALGDRGYARFCAFGHRLDHWLREGGGEPLFDLIEVDNADPGALRHWQHHLGLLSGAPELPEWSPARYRRWRLLEHRHLNPGSPGGPVFHLALQPATADRTTTWQAGDIAEVGPRNRAAAVRALLQAVVLDGDARVDDATGEPTTLRDLLARSHLPEPGAVRGQAAATVAAALRPLPHREYSIASLPADGTLQLLVRRMQRPDGTPGLGSAWLCDEAGPGTEIELRIRENRNFHPPADDRPLLLVGNGTGIAGLRALLKARIAAGRRRNWLVFGERTRAHDFHYRDELLRWQAEGAIEFLDLAFSRDGGGPRYVQDALERHADRLAEWLARDAAVYVCGSLQGMAPAVHARLEAVAGRDLLERMATDGRYRRDVY